MHLQSGLRSWSGRTVVLVALAAGYYVALNAVLIHELVAQVQARIPVRAPVTMRLEDQEPREMSASCAELGRFDRGICRGESTITRASGMFVEHRRERRAAHEELRAVAQGR